nr:hypothetical protein CFP56_22233 [Quercus suber]
MRKSGGEEGLNRAADDGSFRFQRGRSWDVHGLESFDRHGGLTSNTLHESPLLGDLGQTGRISSLLYVSLLPLRRALALPFARQPPARLPPIQRAAAEDERAAQHHFRAERVAEENGAEDERDEFADVQHDRHGDGGGFGREQVDARDAGELRHSVGQEEEQPLR